MFETRICASLKEIPLAAWNALIKKTGAANPFLRYEFLHALHESGCCSEKTGWVPQFITLWQDSALVAALPLYIKYHSYGEYVFDALWADAFHYQDLSYYPKLVSAIPFTPVTGPRLIATTLPQKRALIDAVLHLAQQGNFSSVHCLFTPYEQMLEMQAQGFMSRPNVQFHWQNQGYRDFEDFLSLLSHDKRKKIKQERRALREKNISYTQQRGEHITEEDWLFFNQCYQNTYWEHQSIPYLSLDFFKTLGATMPENIVLILVKMEGVPIASALNFYDTHTLYGRYWGTITPLPGLHFETCYYQGIEFCIENTLLFFEGGAQGTHKLARGLLPMQTWSTHWVAHPQLASAIDKFLTQEKKALMRAMEELNKHSPFKKLPHEKG